MCDSRYPTLCVHSQRRRALRYKLDSFQEVPVKFAKKYLVLLLLALAALAVTETQTVPQTPKTPVIHQDAFFIIGIEARTNAAKEASSQGIIPQQWQKFFEQGILQKIPNRTDQNVYVAYTDFTNKRFGDYSVVIGARVTDKSHIPPGLVLKCIPAGDYVVISSGKGPAERVIPEAWQRIAGAEDAGQLGHTRTYKADYEVYDAASMDPQNLQAELHVGVK
jgi:predicted transcriptional regulator YdeE